MKALSVMAWLRTLPQVLLFMGVGGAAALTHLLVVGVLVWATDMAPLAANVIAFLVAFVVSYNGHAWFTFASDAPRGWRVVAKFFAVASLSFVVNEVLYALALRWLPWHYLISLGLVLVVVAVGTFVMSKYWAFRQERAV